MYIGCKKCYSERDICNGDKTGLFYEMPITAVKFRGEKYVGKKGCENYVMDVRCLIVAGTNKEYFCYWEITQTPYANSDYNIR